EREVQYRKNTGMKVEESVGSYVSRVVPIRDIVAHGWIQPSQFSGDAVAAAVDFFGVETKEQFRSQYENLASTVAFRRSEKFALSAGSLAAWVRYGELLAPSITCSAVDREKLFKSVSDVRQLTRERDPSTFVPKLQQILGKTGVALIVGKTPSH